MLDSARHPPTGRLWVCTSPKPCLFRANLICWPVPLSTFTYHQTQEGHLQRGTRDFYQHSQNLPTQTRHIHHVPTVRLQVYPEALKFNEGENDKGYKRRIVPPHAITLASMLKLWLATCQ